MSPLSSSAAGLALLLLRRTITGGGAVFRQFGGMQAVTAPTTAICTPAVRMQICRMEHRGVNHHFRNPHGTPDDELDERYEAFFKERELDGWDMRQGMNELAGLDMVPSPQVIIAALQACRKNNDYACAIRFLESVKDKCGNKVAEIYPYLVQEIAPTLYDLGIDTPEGLGYDVPELALKDDTYD